MHNSKYWHLLALLVIASSCASSPARDQPDAVGVELIELSTTDIDALDRSPMAFDSDLQQGVVEDVPTTSGTLRLRNDCLFLQSDGATEIALLWKPAKFRWTDTEQSVDFGWFATNEDVLQTAAVDSVVALGTKRLNYDDIDFLVENGCDGGMDWHVVWGMFDRVT